MIKFTFSIDDADVERLASALESHVKRPENMTDIEFCEYANKDWLNTMVRIKETRNEIEPLRDQIYEAKIKPRIDIVT